MATVSPQINAFDVQGLHQLNSNNISKNTALKTAAEQFESIFVRQLLSSMRKVNDLFKEDSIFDSKTTDFYQNMWDDQISINLSKGTLGGISDLLVKQLGGDPAQVQTQHKPVNTLNIQQQQILNSDYPGQTIPKSSTLINSEIKADKIENKKSLESEVITEPDKFSSPQQFIDFIKPLAMKMSEVLGIKPQFIVAQSALETGWGQFIIQSKVHGNSRNLFNIKDKSDWKGKTATKSTVEFDGVDLKQQHAKFRVYDNFKQSVDDFMNFITSDIRYQPLIKSGKNTELYLANLQKSGYATDPEYADKIAKILKSTIIQDNFDDK